MLSDKLFIEPYKLEKVAQEIQLHDPMTWDHEITKAIYDKIPFIAKYNTMIQFEKKDENSGYGYGQIIVNNMINIPIIIYPKKGSSVMAPLDVFNYNNTWYPLTRERIEELLYQGIPYERMAAPTEQVQNQADRTISDVNLPSGGREVLASYGSVLDAVLTDTLKSDVVNFLEKVAQDRSIEAAYRANDTFDAIRKVASRCKEEFKEFRGNKDLPINIMSIEKIGSKFNIKAISDSVYDPTSITVDALTIRKAFGPEILKTASQNGYVLIEKDRQASNAFLHDEITSDIEDLNTCGDCVVKLGMQNEVEGYLFDNVVDFDMNLVDTKVFSNGEKYAVSNKFYGTKGLEKTADFESDCIEDGVVGCFMCSEDPERPIITMPFVASSVMTKEADGITSTIKTFDGLTIPVTYTPYIESIMEKSAGGYYIPAHMKFIKLGTERIHPSKDLGFIKKLAQLEVPGRTVTLRCSGSNYSMQDVNDILSSYESQNLTKHAAMQALLTLGADLSIAERAVDSASKNRITKVGGLRTPNKSYPRADAKLVKMAREIRRDTIKLAAALPDMESVDSMLALNFVTPENIQVFAQYLPTLQDSLSHLAALLVAVRLGLKDIDEYTVKQSMEMLDQVVTKLKDMFTVQNTLEGIRME